MSTEKINSELSSQHSELRTEPSQTWRSELMAKEGVLELTGTIVESLPNTLFRVEVGAGAIPQISEAKIVLCHLSGKMRRHFVRIMPGDTVKLEITPYDLERGRITARL